MLPEPGHIAIKNSGRRPLRLLAGPVLASGAALLMLAGCGASSSAAAPGAQAGAESGGQQLSAARAIGLAARQARQVRSYAVSLRTRSTGMIAESTSGVMQIRLKPTLLGEFRMNLSVAGHALPLDEIVTAHALYLKLAALGTLTGKPWIKVSDAGLRSGSGATIGQLLQGVQNANPLAQTTMLTASADLRQVGTQVINGVQTTHYKGSYPLAGAARKMPAALRSLTGPILKSIGIKTVHFDAWIDGQHQVRKIVTTEAGSSTRLTSTVVITAINQPVSVRLPPASQVATAPPGLGSLGGLG